MRLCLDANRSAYVPLRDAMLCIDCEFLTPAANGKCSICSSNRLVTLVELLELLLEQACGAKAPDRLAELASILAGNNSIRGPNSPNRNPEEPSRFELLRHFDPFVEEDRSCSSSSRTKPALNPVSARNITVSLLRRPRKGMGS
jgi:hypothetical protein